MKKAKIISCFIALLCFQQLVRSQSISFNHLNTSNGLSDNNAQCLAIDRNGFLWIGTTDGLNVYDGYSISTYFKAQQDGLPSDTALHLFVDTQNRTWIISTSGVAWADEEKKFHRVSLPGLPAYYTCLAVLETSAYGIILFTTSGHYYYDEKIAAWKKIEWLSRLITDADFNAAVSFAKNKGIYIYEQRVLLVDYEKQSAVFEKNIANAVTACAFNNSSIAIASRNGAVQITDIATQKELQTYFLYNEINGKRSSPRISEMFKASNGNLFLATGLAGLMMIDSATGEISSYRHDPINTGSVSSDQLYRVLTGRNGELIIASQTAGVSSCNINNKRALYQKIFKDAAGNIFDGHLNEIAEDKNGILWLSAIDRLIRWDKRTNTSVFYYYYFNDPELGPRNLELRTLCIDKKGRIWIGAIGAGVALFDQSTGKFKLIKADSSLAKATGSNYINDLLETSDGKIWACTYGGIYSIDPNSYDITVFTNHPVLKDASDKIVISLYEDDHKRVWIGTQRYGVYCYDPNENKLINYTTDNGLLSNTGYAITGDHNGNIYVADLNGFNVIAANGTIRNFSRKNGMRYHRCESILTDNDGHVWIANNKCLVKFTPINDRLEYFEENAGISMDGFRFTAACKTKDGALYFGTHRGMNYFDPLLIKNYTAQLKVNIYQVALPDTIRRFAGSPAISAGYTENSVQFYFTAINLAGSKNIAYQYKLEGFDADWQRGNDLHAARYSSLSAGNYVFKVKASIDRLNWTEAVNEVSIRIIPPFWRRWWFIAAIAVLSLIILIGALQFRINRIRYKERLKTIYNKKISETEMKALRAQMNPHFIFNSLNSINRYILKSDHATASRYLTRFAKLIRLILDNSNSKEVPLSNELEALRLYIDMEALRFTNKFTYAIQVDDTVNPDSIQVPPLIIQPYVENAIWHGLLHKKSGGHLSIGLKMVSPGMLQCIIEDNGIGREKAKELRSKSATTKKSLGMKLTEERISMLNQYSSLNASIDIIDLEEAPGEPSGTKVIVTIPV